MKYFILLLFSSLVACANPTFPTNVQKDASSKALTNGNIVVPSGTSITPSGSGSIVATGPLASPTVLGLVKYDNSTIQLNGSQQLTAVSGYTLPKATTTTLGGVIVPISGNISIDSSGNITIPNYAVQTSGSQMLAGNGNGGFSNVNIGNGLSFSANTLTASGAVTFVDSTLGQTTVSPNTGHVYVGLASTITAPETFSSTVSLTDTSPSAIIIGGVSGLYKGTAGVVSQATSGVDYAPATSGSSILYGNSSGGFSNATVGTGLAFSGGTLSATSSLSNPMTTLGDTIYGGASGTPSRVVGSTSATPTVYMQTGTGSASASPVWNIVTGSLGNPVMSISPTIYTPTIGNGTSVSNIIINGGTPSGLGTAGPNIQFQNSGTIAGYIGTYGSIVPFTSNTTMCIYSPTGSVLIYPNGTQALNIGSTNIFDYIPTQFLSTLLLQGAEITPRTTITSNVINTALVLNALSISTNTPFTFSGTPSSGDQWFAAQIINTSGSLITATIPSSWSCVQGTTITTVPIPAGGVATLTWQYDSANTYGGSHYELFGDPPLTTGAGATYVLSNTPTIVQPIQALTTPSSSSATGTQGMIEWDASYIYICTATNTWKRAALSTF